MAQTVALLNVPKQKMARLGAIFKLVIPVSALLLDDHGALTAVLVPAAMQAAVMTVVLRTCGAELSCVAVIAVHVAVAANTHVERLGTRDRRGTDDNRGSNYKSELSHSISSNE